MADPDEADRGWVVVGLSAPCQDDETLECVSWVHGPFATSAVAREYAGRMPEGFRPHVLGLDAPFPETTGGEQR